jgi:pentatricopeptide repeat protein
MNEKLFDYSIRLCLQNSTYADEIYTEMINHGFTPTDITMDRLIATLGRDKSIERAVELLQTKQGKCSVITYTTLLSLCINTKMYDLSDIVYQNLVKDKVPLDLPMTNTVIKMFCETSRLLQAESVYQKMIHRGITPDAFTYNLLISGCIKATAFRLGVGIYKDMINHSIQLNTHLGNTVIKLFCKIGDINIAKEIFEKITPDSTSYGIMISGYTGASDYDSGEKLYSHLVRNNLPIDIVIVNTMIKLYCKSNRTEKAIELFHSFQHVADSVTYSTLVHACTPNNHKQLDDLFVNILKRMIPLSNELCLSLYSAFFQQNRPQRAFEVYRTAQADNAPLDVTSFAYLLSHSDSLPLVVELMNRIKDKPSNQRTHLELCILMLCHGYRLTIMRQNVYLIA